MIKKTCRLCNFLYPYTFYRCYITFKHIAASFVAVPSVPGYFWAASYTCLTTLGSLLGHCLPGKPCPGRRLWNISTKIPETSLHRCRWSLSRRLRRNFRPSAKRLNGSAGRLKRCETSFLGCKLAMRRPEPLFHRVFRKQPKSQWVSSLQSKEPHKDGLVPRKAPARLSAVHKSKEHKFNFQDQTALKLSKGQLNRLE